MRNRDKRNYATEQDLKSGNLIIVPAPDEPGKFCFGKISTVGPAGVVYKPIGHDCPLDAVELSEVVPLPITEALLLRVRRDLSLPNDKEHSQLEFRDTPPGERQVEKQYYSNEIDLSRFHLSPNFSYDYPEGFGKDKAPGIKRAIPDFWFVWIQRYGTGSDWFMGLNDIHQYPLRYIHQLQNLFYSISGYKLFIKDEILIEHFTELLDIAIKKEGTA